MFWIIIAVIAWGVLHISSKIDENGARPETAKEREDRQERQFFRIQAEIGEDLEKLQAKRPNFI